MADFSFGRVIYTSRFERTTKCWTPSVKSFEASHKLHTEQFKLSAVEHYLNGFEGYQTVAQHHGVGRMLGRPMVAFYQCHGADGLKKKYVKYSAEFKLSALQHMWNNKRSTLPRPPFSTFATSASWKLD